MYLNFVMPSGGCATVYIRLIFFEAFGKITLNSTFFRKVKFESKEQNLIKQLKHLNPSSLQCYCLTYNVFCCYSVQSLMDLS